MVATEEGAIGAIDGEGNTSLVLFMAAAAVVTLAITASLSALETVVDCVDALGVDTSVR